MFKDFEDESSKMEEQMEEKKEASFLKKTLKTFFGIGFLVLVIYLIFLGKDYFFPEKTPYYIAVAGPMSGKSEINGQAMVKAIRLYLDELNDQGGIEGNPVELLIFDDQNQRDMAKQQAVKIATESQALAVIGHYSSSTGLAASPIYQQYGVPAISGSATADKLTQKNDWYFRTIFNNSDQGALVANYIHKTLDYDVAHILFDEDAYGSTLATAFMEAAEMIGLEVQHQWPFNSANERSFKYAMTDMVETLEASPNDKGIVFLAVHSTEAVEALIALRRSIERYIPIIGADAISSSNFVAKLGKYPKEETQPGYYSDKVYTTSPFILGLANLEAQEFRSKFLEKYQAEPAVTSALYYDATLLAIDAIQKMVSSGVATSIQQQRQQVKDNLWQLSTLADAIAGVTGDLYFNQHGDVIKAIPMGIYKGGKTVAAIRQYQPLQNLQSIEHPLQGILSNHIVLVNNKFMTESQVVYAGIDFTEITDLNLLSSSFEADFYLWFRFKGDFDDRNIEFLNILEATDLGEPILERKSTTEPGVLTRSYRVKARFKVDFNLRKYPLDQQMLPVYFRHKELTTNDLIYVVDRETMGLDKLTGPNADPEKIKQFFSISGWYLNKMAFFQSTQINDSTLGVTELVGNQQRIEYSQINGVLVITRHVLSFILKNLLPVIFLVGLGYLAFFILAFPQKLTLGVNLILASSLFHLKLASDLPNIDYVVLIEYFFYLVYALAVFIIVIAVLSHLTDEEDEHGKMVVQRLNLMGKVVYPFILFIFIGVIIYQNFHLITW
jgi:branched-chain amino acid transport system substrate-binding protein